uniref:Netrin-1 n=1 Tax=Parascaris univalens TaxID=6257 RepID=A0A915A4Q6_PARUN
MQYLASQAHEGATQWLISKATVFDLWLRYLPRR